MPVTSNTGTQTPVIGVETIIATIAGGPFDKVSVYFRGGLNGGGGPIGLALYATVGAFMTRIAETQVMGTANPSIIEWPTPNQNNTTTDDVNAGGTNYTVTVIDLSNAPPPPTVPPRGPCTVTVAGVNEFDSAANTSEGATLTIAAGATSALTIIPGYCQQLDVSIDQTNLPPVTVQVLADCGGGSVVAPVPQGTVSMSGRSAAGIAPVFRQLQLPAATEYTVQLTNNGTQPLTVNFTAATYSQSSAAGAVVALNGDVIGPSNANTVIKWDNVPLLRGAVSGSFDLAQLPDAAVPIFDIGAGEWRAFALSGAVTMTDAGVVSLTGSAVVTLAGNANGPSNANQVTDFGIESVNASVTAAQFTPIVGGRWYVGISGLTANVTVTLPDTMPSGSRVTVKDEDGSLAGFTITVQGSTGKTIDGGATFVMNGAAPGPKGSDTFEMNFSATTEWQVV
jgi:hypothetical protein